MNRFISEDALDKLIKANNDCNMDRQPMDLTRMHPHEAMHLHRVAVMGGSAIEREIVQGFIDAHLAVKTETSDTSTNG